MGEIGRDDGSRHERCAFWRRHRERIVLRHEVSADARDAGALLLQRHQVRRRQRRRERVPPDPRHEEAVGVRVWQLTDEDGIDDAEDGRRPANAERQGDDDRGREARIAACHACGDPEVGDTVPEGVTGALVAHGFFRGLQAAHAQASRGAGLRQSAPPESTGDPLRAPDGRAARRRDPDRRARGGAPRGCVLSGP